MKNFFSSFFNKNKDNKVISLTEAEELKKAVSELIIQFKEDNISYDFSKLQKAIDEIIESINSYLFFEETLSLSGEMINDLGIKIKQELQLLRKKIEEGS